MKKDFFLSLRLKKQDGDLSYLANILGLNIKKMWSSGDSLSNNRVANYSYCVCEIEQSENIDLGKAIENIVVALVAKNHEIENFSNAGGCLNLFVSLDSKEFSGATLDSAQLKLMGDLRISLDIDRLN
ncbi:hypothetical protein LJR074_002218 [Acidovorax sp. LjRoot74]|uniref:hypothetical protein n=1 Tax=Acidovorax sp. LjRoot74 TaxID=3342337 RepID=UPI003ECD6258